MTAAALPDWLVTFFWVMLVFGAARYLMPIVGDRFSERIRTQSDYRLGAKVTRAASRLPAGARAAYEREWQAELQHILHGEHARPVVRLWHGLRYARGLRSAARSIARSYEVRRSVPQRLGRMFARSVRSIALWIAVMPVAALLLLFVAVYVVEMMVVAVAAVFITPVRVVVAGGKVTAVYRRTFAAGLRLVPVAWEDFASEPPSGEQANEHRSSSDPSD
jgi:hypothetical protein